MIEQNWNKIIQSQKLDEFFIGVPLFFLPISINLCSWSMILSSLFFVFKNSKNKYWGRIKLFIVSFVFFGIQFISFSWSANFEVANKKLVLFLPFLIIPFFFLSSTNKKMPTSRIFLYLFYGVFGIVVFGAFRFAFDIMYLSERFDYGRGIELFLKYVPHHVYLSIFILISIIATVKGVVIGTISSYNLILLPLLYFTLFFLASRSAMIIAILVMPILLFMILKRKYTKKKVLIVLSVFYLVICAMGFSIDFSRDKIMYTFYELTNTSTKEKPFLGISFRKKIWKSSINAIKDKPLFGYDIGDDQHTLNSYYSRDGHYEVMDMNTHNQYLQFLLTHGFFIALFIFVLIFGIVRNILLKKHTVLAFSWFVLLVFCFTESILMRQWGVVIFAFVLNLSIYELSILKKKSIHSSDGSSINVM